MDNRKEILNGFLLDTKNQIASFDQKAGILLAIVGVLFALMSNYFNIFDSYNFIIHSNEFTKIICKISFILYIISVVVTLILFILVIFPRKRNNGDNYINNKLNINYYYDVADANLSEDDFKKEFDSFSNSDDDIIEQIIINDKICKEKHKLLEAGFYSLIGFGFFTLCMIIFVVFVF